MSKEMTPKEALQIIQYNLTPRTLGILTVEFNIVEQALDRLEVLENENKKLNFENQALRNGIDLDLNAKLLSENEILKINVKDTYDTSQEIICELTQENEKLKKKINDLKTLTQEKIENASNDYRRCFEDSNFSYSKNDILKGEILAYTDILILLERVLEL